MPKSHDDIKQLQRLLNRVAQLDGSVFRIGDAVFVGKIEAVVDPDLILEAVRTPNTLPASRLQAALRCPALRRVDARWLAAVTRDLKVLESSPGVASLVGQAPRLFRKARIDNRRIEELRGKLEAIHGIVRGPCARSADEGDELAPEMSILESLHGPSAAVHVRRTWELSVLRAGEVRTLAKLRLQRILEGVGGSRVRDAELRECVAELCRCEPMPGRARRRRVARLVVESLSELPLLPNHIDASEEVPRGLTLAGEIEAIGEALIGRIPSTRTKEYRARLTRCLARYALMFPPGMGDAPRVIEPDMLAKLERGWPDAKNTLAGAKLSLCEALAWASRVTPNDHQRGLVARWLRQGLPWSVVEAELDRGPRASLPPSDWPLRKASSYLSWKARLAPALQGAGIDADLGPESFAALDLAKEEEVGVLCLALIGQRKEMARVLDATLGLFRKVPETARKCLKDLDSPPRGLGCRTDPELAAWLDDDELLDRYLHLRSLLGEPRKLSSSLRRDVDRQARVQRQREHLGRMVDPSEAIQARLRRLAHQSSEVTTDWTRRHMAERVEWMTARLYRKRLDEALRDIVARAFGVVMPELTDAWFDVVRFYLRMDRNTELMATLLRETSAFPGTFLPPRLPANRPWMTRAESRMNLGEWCGRHPKRVTLGPLRGTIALEHDPIEVLRVGVPFETCLSIEEGCNAPSAVMNAVDINKRVIYFRGDDGTPVARKLIAVSREFRLIGYRVYSTVGMQSDLARMFDDYCVELAKRCGLLLGDAGAPERIHEGFWYDDGVEAFGLDSNAAVVEYVEGLGLPAPRRATEALRREAALHRGRATENVSVVLSALAPWGYGKEQREAGRWLIGHLGVKEVERLAATNEALVPLLAAHYANVSPAHLARAARRLLRRPRDSEAFHAEFRALPADAAVGFAMLEAAAVSMRHSRRFDDHGIEHGTMNELPRITLAMSIREILCACDDADRVWDWVVEQSEGCGACRANAGQRIVEAARRRYLHAPDALAVGDCLGDPNRGELAHRVALGLASMYPAPQRNEVKPPSVFDVMGRRPGGAAWMRKRLRALARVRPELESTACFLAAWLRQGRGLPISEDTLPNCQAPPFEELGDLVFHVPGLLEYLLAWGDPSVGIEGWAPGPWELYFHRRKRTPWRRTLVREVLAKGPQMVSAWNHLVEIGDIESFRYIAENMPAHALRGTAIRFDEGHDIDLLVSDAASQIALDSMPADGDLPACVSKASCRTDMETVRRALETVRRYRMHAYGDRTPEQEKLGMALQVLRYPALNTGEWEALIQVVFATPGRAIPDVMHAVLEEMLRAIPAQAGGSLSAQTLLVLGQCDRLEEAVVALLPAWADFATYRRVVRELGIAAGAIGLSADRMVSSWLSRLVSCQSAEDIVPYADDSTVEVCFRGAFATAQPNAALRLLDAVPDAASVALWMRIFREQSAACRAAIAAAADREAGWDEGRNRRAWVRQVESELRLGTAGGTQS